MCLAGASQRQKPSIWVCREGLPAKVTVKPSVGAEKSLGLNILFILQPLLFELVVTPGALAPVNLALAQETQVDAHVATDALAESSGAPVSVSSAHPPEAHQGPVRPAVHANMAQVEGMMSGGAGIPCTGCGSATGAQSRERAAA